MVLGIWSRDAVRCHGRHRRKALSGTRFLPYNRRPENDMSNRYILISLKRRSSLSKGDELVACLRRTGRTRRTDMADRQSPIANVGIVKRRMRTRKFAFMRVIAKRFAMHGAARGLYLRMKNAFHVATSRIPKGCEGREKYFTIFHHIFQAYVIGFARFTKKWRIFQMHNANRHRGNRMVPHGTG